MDETVTFQPQGRGLKPSGILKKHTDFGPYHILEHLDRGGMGDVYKARHNKLERVVALKVLPTVLSSNEYLERFNAEAFAISRLQHQNVVTIYDYGEINHRRFIAMQYITGTTLTELIERKKKLSYGQIIDIAKQICRGLQSLHNKGIVHRDIKSGNVMIDNDYRAFISDFGIAQITGETRLTTTGMAMGTPEYMSPEQCQGFKINEQSDIYSFGIVLYEMITGRPPFMGENPLSIAYKQVHEIPPLVSKAKKDVPPRLELIVAKCLKKDIGERYLNTAELLNDMDSIQQFTDLVGPVPESEGPTVVVPVQKEKRITDRREANRQNASKKDLHLTSFVLPALAIVLLTVYATLQFMGSVSDKKHPGNWLEPDSFTVLAPLADPESNREPFRGQGFHLEVLLNKKSPANFYLEFTGLKLVRGLVYTARVVAPGSDSKTNLPPLKISLLQDDKPLQTVDLIADESPHLMNFKPQLTSKVPLEITLGSGKNLPTLQGPVRVRLESVRLLGSPY